MGYSIRLDHIEATILFSQVRAILKGSETPETCWTQFSRVLQAYPFAIQLILFTLCYPEWREKPESAPAFIPSPETIKSANITQLMRACQCDSIQSFHDFSIRQRERFWQLMIDSLSIQFNKPWEMLCDLSKGVNAPVWFKGATMNIIKSCFQADGKDPALIYQNNRGELETMSYAALDRLSSRVANSLAQQGLKPGDAIGIAMPMNHYAVAIYLGIIKLGGMVISIADSFSAQEMAARLNITNTRVLFTQDTTHWSGKTLPLYDKIKNGCDLLVNKGFSIVVVPEKDTLTVTLRTKDVALGDFLVANENFVPADCQPMSPCNILFSSGTTAAPKAIPWDHTTPIKVATDACLHHNVQPGDVLCWPTNLGWMMGPWMIFAALINRATLALYTDAPKDRAFGEFVQRTKVTMLGVVPTLVATWRQTHCMEQLDWRAIKVFSSSGECSNPEDMLYLMWLAGYKPVIEYCGGTEIGGAYLSSTVIEKNYPALFNGPTMGLNILLLDEEGHPASSGEVAIVPPSIGLSTTLLNADHDEIYFAHMPASPDGKPLRRHGDQAIRYPHGHYSILGRSDDAMNLGGIKVSAAEIERCLSGLPDILEVAAIAIPAPRQGPSLLIIYAATTACLDKETVKKTLQKKLNVTLNPLFKIHDVIFVAELPKTASNKIMRRTLRDRTLALAGSKT